MNVLNIEGLFNNKVEMMIGKSKKETWFVTVAWFFCNHICMSVWGKDVDICNWH